jgi:excisionase family DNA binding protein
MEKLPKKALLRPDEVAKFWGVSRATIYRWADSGVIKAVRKGGVIRISREEAEKISCESG